MLLKTRACRRHNCNKQQLKSSLRISYFEMATTRRKNLLRSRRRVTDEGEDDDSGPIPLELDSHSDGSQLSDVDESLDAAASDTSDVVSAQEELNTDKHDVKENGHFENGKHQKQRPRNDKTTESGALDPDKPASFKNTVDTDTMLNGVSHSSRPNDAEEMLFEDTVKHNAHSQPVLDSRLTTPSAKRSQATDHNDHSLSGTNAARFGSKPPMVPNRGGFFMHDQRNGTAQPIGTMSGGRGRGRGRGQGPIINFPEPLLGTGDNGRWSHDLHDTVLDQKPSDSTAAIPLWGNRPTDPLKTKQPSLSTSVAIGTVPLRVLLPDMNVPVTFGKTAIRQHTRLPDLRPPLRRDKPVRVFLPDNTPRYIFPSVERSFIFIPRAQRPNQQRGRLRGTRQSSQFGSRRTSIYGGSNYTPSIAVSRRSSQARDGIISPAGSMMSRPIGVPTGPARPVVKLPDGAQTYGTAPNQGSYMIPTPGSQMFAPPQHWPTYPLPSRPTYRENRSGHIPMHQPKPQKAVSVATIESPAPQPLQTPNQSEEQPFHQQARVNIDEVSSRPVQHFHPYATSGSAPVDAPSSESYPSVAEQTVDAQPFQPGVMQPPAQYIPAYPMQNMVYYPTPDGQDAPYASPHGAMPPVYMQQTPHAGYMVPMFMPQPSIPEQPASPSQTNLFAHESNGMVYYSEPSQMPNGGSNQGIPPANFTMPGMGGIMTPGPDGYYYDPTPQTMVYYPSQ